MNKTILITGISKGIGRAIAEIFAANGFNIAGCARDKTTLDNFKTELWNKFPGQKFLFSTCDVTDKADLNDFAIDVLSEFDKIDVLVNNAGKFLPGQITNEEDGTFEKMMALNVSSAYHLSRKIVPQMIKNKSGHVFNLASIASITAYNNGGSYCISKFAMHGFSKVLREEMKPHNVKVTSILPGATFTSSWEGTELPPSRFMKPEDVANIVWSAYNLSENCDVEEIVLRPQLGDI